jgi:hypothetical protein
MLPNINPLPFLDTLEGSRTGVHTLVQRQFSTAGELYQHQQDAHIVEFTYIQSMQLFFYSIFFNGRVGKRG